MKERHIMNQEMFRVEFRLLPALIVIPTLACIWDKAEIEVGIIFPFFGIFVTWRRK
jgi:hypothetical protein